MTNTSKILRNTTLTLAVTLCASSALAENVRVNEEISSRPELSLFYDALQSTGVAKEMNKVVSYTVFAPNNEAMRKISYSLSDEDTACAQSQKCNEALAKILRNHIVPEEVAFSGPDKLAAYSIDGESLSFSQPRKGDYFVNGAKVETQYQLGGGILYEINKVLATPQEKLDFKTYAEAMHTASNNKLLEGDMPQGGIAVETSNAYVTQKT